MSRSRTPWPRPLTTLSGLITVSARCQGGLHVQRLHVHALPIIEDGVHLAAGSSRLLWATFLQRSRCRKQSTHAHGSGEPLTLPSKDILCGYLAGH